MSGVIETWNLIWVLPITFWLGFMTCAFVCAFPELWSEIRKIGKKDK